MSQRQKREVADELMMQPSAFGVLFIAAALLLLVASPLSDKGGGKPAGDQKEVISLLH